MSALVVSSDGAQQHHCSCSSPLACVVHTLYEQARNFDSSCLVRRGEWRFRLVSVWHLHHPLPTFFFFNLFFLLGQLDAPG